VTSTAASTSSSGGSGRGSSLGRSVDAALLSSEPELVLQHLRARRAAPSLLSEVGRVGASRAARSVAIVEGDAAKSQRKALSAQIGKLVQQGSSVEAAVSKLKAEVASCANTAAACNERIAAADAALHAVLGGMPNLLCDSVPDGDGDDANVQVRQWQPPGEDFALKVAPEGDGTYLWHDDILAGLGTCVCGPVCLCMLMSRFCRTNPICRPFAPFVLHLRSLFLSLSLSLSLSLPLSLSLSPSLTLPYHF